MPEQTVKQKIGLSESLLFRLLPAQMLMPAVTSVIAIINGIIAGQFIEEKAVGVVGLYAVVSRVIEAVALVLLAGSVVMCGRSMGEGDTEKTDRIFSVNLILSFVLGILFTAVCFLFAGPLAALLGAKGDLAGQLESYIYGMAIGIVPFMLGRQIASFLQLERKGNFIYAAVGVMLAVNVALDVYFVVFNGMGIRGLALATSISNWLYFAVMVSYYFSKQAQLHFSLSAKGFHFLPEIVSIGASEAFLSFAISVESLILNRVILAYAGENALSAFSSVMMAMNLIISYGMGVGNVVRSLASISLGEEDKDELFALKHAVLTKAFPLGFAVAVVLFFITLPLPGLYFRTGSETYVMARQFFTVLCACIPILVLVFTVSNYLQAKKHRVYSMFLSFYDGLVSVVVPCLLLTPLFGATGMWISYPIGFTCTLLVSVIYCCIYNRGIPRNQDEMLFLKPDFGVKEENRLIRDLHSIDEVSAMSQEVQQFCLDHKMDPELANHAAVCMEEMASNVILHGFTKDKKRHNLQVRVVFLGGKEPSVLLRIKDDCVRFNPQERAQQTGKGDPLKNLGIRMVMSIAKEVTYQSFVGLNVLTVRI